MDKQHIKTILADALEEMYRVVTSDTVDTETRIEAAILVGEFSKLLILIKQKGQ